MRIAFFELDTHAEIAANFMTLMQGSERFEVDYFFSSKIERFLAKSSAKVTITSPYLLLSQLRLKKYDLVIIGTVHRNFDLYLEITKHFNTAIIVHNLNFTKIALPNLVSSVLKQDVIYRLKLLMKEGLLSAAKVFHSAKHLLVLDQNLAKSEYKFLPVFFVQEHESQAKSPIVTIVVPGTVDQKRRNYRHILNKISKFEGTYKIVFLGKATGQELLWLKDFEKKNIHNIELVYFEEKVSQKDFDQWMRSADLLWCPVQEETEFFSHPEIYGQTKMSGNIGDAIKYGKPAIFPKSYPAKYPFIYAEEENLEEQALEILDLENISFQQFNKDEVLQKLENTLLKLI